MSSDYSGGKLKSETRRRLMWQLKQMTCPVREKDSHLPFIKAQLKLLEDTAHRTVESHRSGVTKAAIALYKTHLKNIFRDAIVSFTSLNIKSAQCAILFTKMIHDTATEVEKRQLRESDIDDGLYEFYKTAGWDTYDVFLTLTDDHMDLPYTVFTDEDGHCIPNCKNKAIIVLLGEMTLFELLWSLSNDLYFVGLPTQTQYADGRFYIPTTFLEHDLGHMIARLDTVPEAVREEENRNVKKCLLYINDKSKEIQDAVLLFLFLFMHLEVQGDPTVLRVPHTVDSGLFRRDDHPHSRFYKGNIIQRLKSRDDLGGFLPEGHATTDAALEAWLLSQWLIFIEHWNACLSAEAAEAAVNIEYTKASGNRYLAKTFKNAASWNRRKATRRASSGKTSSSSKKTSSSKKRTVAPGDSHPPGF